MLPDRRQTHRTARANGWCDWPISGAWTFANPIGGVGKLALIIASALRPCPPVQTRQQGSAQAQNLSRAGCIRSTSAAGSPATTRLEEAFARELTLARRVCAIRTTASADRRSIRLQFGLRLNASAKARSHRPYEFGVKVSVCNPTLHRSRGGQVHRARRFIDAGQPRTWPHACDRLSPATRQTLQSAVLSERAIADAGLIVGHNAPPD